jgi:DNA mismatch repair protein MLH3
VIGQRRSPRRLERYPIYVLDVTLPAEEVDLAYDPKKRILGYRVS